MVIEQSNRKTLWAGVVEGGIIWVCVWGGVREYMSVWFGNGDRICDGSP